MNTVIYSLNRLLNTAALLTSTTPFGILGKHDGWAGDNASFVRETGLVQLGQVLNAFGILSAAIIIITSLGTLVIVNFPKTVAQTKEKVANALMTVAFIAAFPFIADVIYSVAITVFFD